MAPREGRIVRPLLALTRGETAAYNEAHGLPWREDASNDSPDFARNRIRAGLLRELTSVHPAANRLEEILALHEGALDLGDGVRAVVESGVLRMAPTPPLPARQASPRN